MLQHFQYLTGFIGGYLLTQEVPPFFSVLFFCISAVLSQIIQLQKKNTKHELLFYLFFILKAIVATLSAYLYLFDNQQLSFFVLLVAAVIDEISKLIPDSD